MGRHASRQYQHRFEFHFVSSEISINSNLHRLMRLGPGGGIMIVAFDLAARYMP